MGEDARPVKGRIRVPEETTGYIVGLEEDNARLRACIAELEAYDSVREDYPLRCGDCNRAHILDCSLPSETWNKIARPEEMLCPVCIDSRLQTAGLKCNEAEFYYGGSALQSKMYAESHGEVAFWKATISEFIDYLEDHGKLGGGEMARKHGDDPMKGYDNILKRARAIRAREGGESDG